MRFYLGVDPPWLAQTDVPLFVSHRRLVDRKRLPRALGPWALDSGGFTELTLNGGWVTTPAEYVEAARRYRDEVGGLEWCVGQDWMCGPAMFEATGRDLDWHQRATVANLLELRELAPDLDFVPTLQGWTPAEYLRCAELYEAAGVDLGAEPVVGVGSIAARHASSDVMEVLVALSHLDLSLHGFGVKTGLVRYSRFLASADSFGWSFRARRREPLPGCTHKKCNHCLKWALLWREELLERLGAEQMSLFERH